MGRLRHGLETGADFEEDFRLLTPGRRVRWVTVRSVPIGVSDEMTDGRLGTMEDVSERRAVQEALRRSEELYRSVIETMTEGVVIETAEGVLVEANPAARTLLGINSGDLREVRAMREDGTALPADEFPIAIALRTGARCTGVSLAIRHDARGERWLNVSAQPLWRDDDGPPWAAVCTFTDVTERRKVDQLKNEFVSIVSHEMRTPLTSIKGSLGLISSGATGLLGETAQQMVDIALKNTDWIIRLVNDMLDLERIESGRSESVRAHADLTELVALGLSAMRQRAERNGLRLVNDAGSEHLAVVVHSDRIVQTMTNLVSNAIKFSTRGGVIRVALMRQVDADGNDEVAVRVIDHGRGVPQDRAHDIFERFHQVDASDSRDKGGTGLGLAICKTIVEEHGGRIWVEETPGGGATFVFTLPLPVADVTDEGGGHARVDRG
jgi:PAS domain S-box-containing protein